MTYPDYNVAGYYKSIVANAIIDTTHNGPEGYGYTFVAWGGNEDYGTVEVNIEATRQPDTAYKLSTLHSLRTIYEQYFYFEPPYEEPSVEYLDQYGYSFGGEGGNSYYYTHTFSGNGQAIWLNEYQRVIDLGETYNILDAAPNITSLSIDRGLIGDVIEVVITGQRLGDPQNNNLTTVNVPADSGITVSNVKVNSRTEVAARLTIDVSLTGGNKPVTLRYRNQTSNAANFFVQIPTSVTGPNSLGSKTTYNGQPLFDANNVLVAQTFFGYTHAFRYSVKDQEGVAILSPNMTQTEYIQFAASHNNVSTGDRTTTSPVRDNSGFDDLMSYGFPTPPAPQPGQYLKQKQTIYISLVGGGFSGVVRVNCIDKQYNDVSIVDVTATPNVSCQ